MSIVRPSYLYNGNSYTGKTTFLYWDEPRRQKISILVMLNTVKFSINVFENAFYPRWHHVYIYGTTWCTLRSKQNGTYFADAIFTCIFVTEDVLFYQNISDVCPYASNWQQVSTGACNGLWPFWYQATTWTNDNLVQWRKYASSGIEMLQQEQCVMAGPLNPSLWYQPVNQ